MGRTGVDLTGQRFGQLTVIKLSDPRLTKNGKPVRYWLCQCACGNFKEATTSNLKTGNTASCGCLRKSRPAPNSADLTDRRFGWLVAISRAPSREHSGSKFGYWNCLCDCGNYTVAMTGNLTSGKARSCGCYIGSPEHRKRISEAKFVHGYTMSDRTYRSWVSMKKRCRERAGYADRGITYAPAWESFENFLADMGERPPNTTLDRIDNDGDYAPGNCRWATGLTQGNNRSNNRRYTHNGSTLTVAEWARECGVPRGVMYHRLVYKGFTVAQVMEEFPPPG